MKKLILNLILALSMTSVFSQIPNNGFENWTNFGPYQEPNNWTSSNSMYYMIDMFGSMMGVTVNHPTSAIKDPNAQAGSFSIQLKNVVGTEDGEVSDTMPGFVGLGTMSMGGPDKSGIPFTQRPSALTGYYKFTQGAPNGSPTLDTAWLAWGVTKWNATTKMRETVGFGQLEIYQTQTTFTPFTIDIEYENGTTPDTLTIIFISSGTEKIFPGTTLNIDGLALTGITSINNAFASINPVHVFPNPATTEINLNELPKGTTSIEVKDMTGRAIKEISVQATDVNFSTADLPSGLYYYGIKNENGDVLYTGKFDVKN